MTTRLFTFGCSLTQWWWPTWADIISVNYDYFENWGVKGCGNRTIVERLSEFLLQNKITADDTIVVQWTDFHRHDIHMSLAKKDGNWSSSGGIFVNKHTPEWIKEYWTEESYIMHSMNFINFGINLLKQQPCKWVMTTSTNLTHDFPRYPKLNFYKQLFDCEFWINPPIYDFVREQGYTGTEFNCDILVKDLHPDPEMHALWAEQCLLPIIGGMINQPVLDNFKKDFEFIKQMTNEQEQRTLNIWKNSQWYMEKNTVFGL